MSHAIRGLLRAGVARVLVAARDPRAYAPAIEAVADPHVVVVPGGRSVAVSLRSALTACEPGASDIVLVQDAARPFTPATTIRAVVDTIRAGAPAAVPVEPVTDTVKAVDTDGTVLRTVDRSLLRSAQSPQGFRAEVLRGAELTDPIGSLGSRVHPVPGHPHAMRVGTAFDLAVVTALLAEEEAAG